jgi:hypothetical protein
VIDQGAVPKPTFKLAENDAREFERIEEAEEGDDHDFLGARLNFKASTKCCASAHRRKIGLGIESLNSGARDCRRRERSA